MAATNYIIVLLAPSEDGGTFEVLDQGDIVMLLKDPREERGITKFEDSRFLASRPDPNSQSQWPPGSAVLLRCEVIVPVPAGSYVLPAE